MTLIILSFFALGFILSAMTIPGKYLQYLFNRIKPKLHLNKNRIVFESNYVEVKSFYLKEYNIIPCISYINNLDTAEAFAYLNQGMAGKVLSIYQRNYYNWQHQRQEFGTTVFKLKGRILVELGDDYAEVLFENNNYPFAENLMKIFATYKAPEKVEDFEINIITQSNLGLDLKQLNIKPTALDIDWYYNDDFKPIDEIIKKRLEKENDKGIILLHGLPGTGKTTYLRHLIGNMKKKVLFVSPGVAGNLMNPEFIDILIDNPNAVLVIEDAENIIIDRKYSNNSSVSNLLNISDGLLSDCLNVQIICTFNNALSMVDSALLRKGRLIAKYEFNKLNAIKAQRLSDHLGFNKIIDKPMTIAEITNPEDMDIVQPSFEVIGFRRETVMN
jgi:ATPase family associated with various cellular activities (AAA)